MVKSAGMTPKAIARLFLLTASIGACGGAAPRAPSGGAASASVVSVAQVRRDAAALAPLVSTKLAKDFLAATSALPDEQRRSVVQDGVRKELDYYETKYGSPLAYARAVELLGEAGVDDVAGKKVIDFGYGTIGHLRLFASLGANAIGIDVDPVLPLLYSRPNDTGRVAGVRGVDGTVTLLDGRFPADAKIASAVGTGADVFLSKNTLKRGYVHPDRPAPAKLLIDLGVTDEAFVAAVFAALKPGGRAMLYNVCPKQAAPNEPFVPWADGRSPFSKETWEKAGFQVAYIDRDDTKAVRAMAKALGWDKGDDAVDLDADLFAWVTLVTRAP